MTPTVEAPRRAILLALSLAGMVFSVWMIFLASRGGAIDRRITNVASSSTGRWLAAGTAQGKITVWDRTRGDAPKQITFPHGAMNDLRFSPDESELAIASKDLGMYTPSEPAAPRLLRFDGRNYGSVRFGRGSESLQVVTGTDMIETIDVHSGAVRLKICCSSVYGEAVFTPDGQAIASAGYCPSLWDARSGQLLGRLTANREFLTFRPIGFDTGGSTILMGSQDGRVYAWDLSTKHLAVISPAQSAYVDTLAESESTGWVIFAGLGNEVGLWNPVTGRRRIVRGARPTSNVVLSADGSTLLFGTSQGDVEFWDLRTAQRMRAIRIPGQ